MEQRAYDHLVLGAAACLVGGFLFCYGPILVGMVLQWWNVSFYSYAFLIPVVSAYLVWIRRDQLSALVPQPDYMGGAVLLGAGILALLIGQAGGVKALQQVSLLITLPGMVLWLFGKAVLRALWLPIAFLWFMIPIWEVVTDPLHLPFQSFSANLGVMMLRVVGIPVYQDGVFIHLPNITLEVARACSGVNYLIAVLATSIPLATIVLTAVWRRVVLVLLAMAVSALANSLRVALIGMLAYYDLSGDLHGPYHMLHGVFVSLVGYAVIFGGLWALSRGQSPAVFASAGRMWSFKWDQVRTSWITLSAVLALIGAVQYVDRSYPVPLKHNLSELSLEGAGWIGRDISPLQTMQGADQSLSRSYRATSGEEVMLSLWYFDTQTQGKELVYPGTDKLHANAGKIKLSISGQSEVELNRRFVRDRGNTRMVVFWYDLNGRILVSPLAVKCYTAFDAVVHGRTNGALMWVAVDLVSDDQAGEEQAVATLARFVSTLYPALDRYLPNPAD
ncbi:MAG: EpsI family protein [Nitrospira sp.]|nr:EpsI family protein [Nitrospira sp.]